MSGYLSYFSRDPSSSFAFEIGTEITGLDSSQEGYSRGRIITGASESTITGAHTSGLSWVSTRAVL